ADYLVESREVTVQQIHQVLGGQIFGSAGESDEVGKKNSDVLEIPRIDLASSPQLVGDLRRQDVAQKRLRFLALGLGLLNRALEFGGLALLLVAQALLFETRADPRP